MKQLARIAAFIIVMMSFCMATAQTKPIDFTQQLTNAANVPIIEPGTDGKSQPMQLWEVAVNALEANTTADAALPGLKKFELDQLARKIYKNKSCVLTADELKTIKERIGQDYGPMIVGAAWSLLGGSELPK